MTTHVNTAHIFKQSNKRLPELCFKGKKIYFYHPRIFVTTNDGFDVTYNDMRPKSIQTNSDGQYRKWFNSPMSFYINQYSFALYCATTMCGLSKDHLDRTLPLTRSILLFHIYYQTKKILAELQVKLPGDEGFDPLDNPYNKGVLQLIKNEFNYNPPRGADIFIDQNSRGFGSVYNYID